MKNEGFVFGFLVIFFFLVYCIVGGILVFFFYLGFLWLLKGWLLIASEGLTDKWKMEDFLVTSVAVWLALGKI